jgi:segregation and condensation protein B
MDTTNNNPLSEEESFEEALTPQEDSEEISEENIASSVRQVERIIEALFFTALEPLTLSQIRAAIKLEFPLSKNILAKVIEKMKKGYIQEDRSFELIQGAMGYQLRTKAEFSQWVKRILKKQSGDRLSKAALETLAIIAYKQPITRAEIEEIRGVNGDSIMKILLDKKFIHVSGKKNIPGAPWQYSTTKDFLLHFGLKTLQELPPPGFLNLN